MGIYLPFERVISKAGCWQGSLLLLKHISWQPLLFHQPFFERSGCGSLPFPTPTLNSEAYE